MLFHSILRTIRSTLVRYLAILAIIALGVGFFVGLRVTEESIIKTADGYLSDLRLYDYRLVSTLGFTEEDVTAFAALDGIDGAFGSVSHDVLYQKDDGTNGVRCRPSAPTSSTVSMKPTRPTARSVSKCGSIAVKCSR